MAIYVNTTAQVGINGVDLSDHVRSVTFATGAEAVDVTAMAATTRTNISGLKTVTIDVEFFQDFASAKVDDTLDGLIGGASVWFNYIPTTSAVGATNPRYNGPVVIENYEVISGAVGTEAIAKVTMRPAGAFSRSVSGTVTSTSA